MTEKLEIELDSETGLPVLPDGYFWRVTFENFEWGNYSDPRPSVRVDLRKNLPNTWYRRNKSQSVLHHVGELFDRDATFRRPGTMYREYRWIEHQDEEIQAFIVDLAKTVYRKHQVALEQVKIRQKTYAQADRFEGDYPPKSVKGRG